MLQDTEMIQANRDDDDDFPSLPLPKAAGECKPCCTLKVCICQDIGREAHFFWESLSRHFRMLFWKRKKVKSPARKLLDQYAIVVQLVCTAKVSLPLSFVDGSELDALFEAELQTEEREEAGSVIGPRSIYFHIGSINLRNYHFSVLHLDWLQSHQPSRSSSDAGDGGLQVLTPFPPQDAESQATYSDLEAFSRLVDFRHPWKASIMKLESEFGPWLLHNDGSVPVRPIDGVDPFICWHGSLAEQDRRREQQRAKDSGRTRKRGPGQHEQLQRSKRQRLVRARG